MRFYFFLIIFESAVELALSFDIVVLLCSLMAKKGGAFHTSYSRYNHYYHLNVSTVVHYYNYYCYIFLL